MLKNISKTQQAIKSVETNYQEDLENLKKLPKSDLNTSCVFFYESFLDQLQKIREAYEDEIKSENN